MLLKQFLRLGGNGHAIKEAAISLFFGSPFVDLGALQALIQTAFRDEFTQFQNIQVQAFRLELPQVATTDALPAEAPTSRTIGFQATHTVDTAIARVLQMRNDEDRVLLSLHNLRYGRWFDFMELFERVVTVLAPVLKEAVVVGASLHYVDELEWTHPTLPLPLHDLYQQNPAYFPTLFFKSSFGEVSLTAPQTAGDFNFIDRLHITSATNGKPLVTISHNVVHGFKESANLLTITEQPNLLANVLQQAHEHNKNVLREILQPEVQEFIGLTPPQAP